jgi:aminopeptidase N
LLDDAFAAALAAVLRDPLLDAAFKARVLMPPPQSVVAEQMSPYEPQRLHTAHTRWRQLLADRLHADWLWAFETHAVNEGYSPDHVQAGHRALANLALQMICLHAVRHGDGVWPGRAYQRVKDAANMSDRAGALMALTDAHSPLAEQAVARFFSQAQGDALMLDQWFALQARVPEPLGADAGAVFQRVKALLSHPAFSMRNPNRMRSLLNTLFVFNPSAFHRTDAAGYVLWAERLIELDGLNPQVAGRQARAMDRWASLAEPYRSAAREAIARVAARNELSDDVREVVGHALEPSA